MNTFRLSLVLFICVLFSLVSFAEEETDKPDLDVRELSPGLYVGEGETPAGEKIYFGMEKITADSEPGIDALERMTSRMFQMSRGLVSVSLYFCMDGKSDYSSLDDYKGNQQIGLNNTEFEALHRRLCDKSADLNSRYEQMVGGELNFRGGSEGDYVAYAATKTIEKPNTWKGETIKEYLDTTKNLIMTAAVSKELVPGEYQRTYVSMIDGGHKDAAAHLHGFISAVTKKFGNPKASSISSTPIEVIEAPFEEECRKIDTNKPQTIKPAIDACSSWIQWAREEEKKLNSLSYLEKLKQEERLPKLPDSAVEEALINMKNACKSAEAKNWNCLNMTAGLQNQLAEKIVVRPELNEPLLIEEAFVFQNMDEVPDDVLRGSLSLPAPCAEPSLWSSADKKRVKDLLESYSKKLPGFMKTLEAGRKPGGAPIALVKCKKTDGENGRVATAYKGYVREDSRYLFLAEHVFTTDSDPKISEYLGFQTLSFTLLHELAHLWDFSHEKNVSSTQEFINIFGWAEAFSFGLGQLKTFKKNEIEENLTEMMKLAGAGKYLDALKTTVEFGRTHGYPTSYSMSVPKEMLAEFVAWIYHSPETKKYLEPKLMEYVNNNILE